MVTTELYCPTLYTFSRILTGPPPSCEDYITYFLDCLLSTLLVQGFEQLGVAVLLL